jgi:hypothetical protein
MQQIINEIHAHIVSRGGVRSGWYVGIASEPRECLFSRHGASTLRGGSRRAGKFRDFRPGSGDGGAIRVCSNSFHTDYHALILSVTHDFLLEICATPTRADALRPRDATRLGLAEPRGSPPARGLARRPRALAALLLSLIRGGGGVARNCMERQGEGRFWPLTRRLVLLRLL